MKRLQCGERNDVIVTDLVMSGMTGTELMPLGYRVAVDDLGAGYAGRSCVNLLEPDIVKLDMSLIRNVDVSARKRSLVGSMLRVCQLAALVAAGATLLQGYLFASVAAQGHHGTHRARRSEHAFSRVHRAARRDTRGVSGAVRERDQARCPVSSG